MNQNLIQSARKLRLSGLLLSLEMRLQEAISHQLSHEQFLELVLQDELNVRAHRLVERRKKAAAFRELKPLDEFEWDFNPSIKRAQIYELATANFIRQNRDILLLGPPGVGKSCLAQAIGYAAIKAGFVAFYCSVFDLVRDLQADESLAQARPPMHRRFWNETLPVQIRRESLGNHRAPSPEPLDSHDFQPPHRRMG